MAGGPTIGGLEVGDVATWVSGVGTFLAVAATVWLAWRAERRSRDDIDAREQAAEKIFAMRMLRPLKKITSSLAGAGYGVKLLESGHARGVRQMLTIDGQDDIAQLARRAEDWPNISLDVINALTRVETAVEAHNRMADRLGDMLEQMDAGDDDIQGLAQFAEATLAEARLAVTEAIKIFGRHDVALSALTYMIGSVQAE